MPEIYNGTVEIKSIAREPGQRSKVAVAALQPGVDPVGSCVGMRGVRIQAIVNELNGEKIDVIEWNPDPGQFIANALSPAKVTDGHPGRHHRQPHGHRGGAGQAAFAGHRQGRPERPPERQADRLAHRHQEREPRPRAEGLDDFARELGTKRARLAMARSRAESEDILSVAEQLLSDEVVAITAETLAEGELPAYAVEGDEYDVD